MSLEQKSKHKSELTKSRWLVRYAILTALFCILAVKFYMMLYVLDIVVGAYSFVTTFVLFNILLITYTKYKDPYIKADNLIHLYNSKPLVTIVVPVKNEEENIRRCVQSCINSTYSSKQIIVVNDGSTDQTARILDNLHKEHPDLHIIHLSKSIGKKKAIEMATEIAKGEIYFFMDSDCNMANDAVENAVKIFLSDRTIGAVTAHGRVRGAENGSTLEKLQDVWYDGQYRIIKGMESSFSSLTCCSGALTGFRRAAVQPHMHAWAHDRFLGGEFKFATDRRLTAYVLGAKSSSAKKSDKDDETPKSDAYSYMSLLSTGNDDFELMKRSSDSDIFIEEKSRYRWKLQYSPHVRVYIGPPETFPSLIRQQIRWRKSFIRSIFATGGVYWRRPFFAALLYYLQVGLKIIRPYVVLQSLILLPLLSNDYYSGIFYIVSVIFSGMIYGIDFRLRNPGSPLWLYRPLITILSTLVFSWLLVYAAITIKKTAWR
ncbi:MAG TPA: glycosyltransferase [Nitrososphaeraceae archaeon]|nr:glycosyltransferase [Nitrososphaeraceae archaeon]